MSTGPINLDAKQAMFLVLLDLSSAFDTIDQGILLKRLSSVGLEGCALSWFASYMNSRSQSVKICESLSSRVQLPYGVPQGSVLGPSLFSIYSGPLADIARSHGVNVHLYADDTQLYLPFNPLDPDSVTSNRLKIEACVTEMKAWMLCNKLKLNDANV